MDARMDWVWDRVRKGEDQERPSLESLPFTHTKWVHAAVAEAKAQKIMETFMVAKWRGSGAGTGRYEFK